jgi:hypothetical protein
MQPAQSIHDCNEIARRSAFDEKVTPHPPRQRLFPRNLQNGLLLTLPGHVHNDSIMRSIVAGIADHYGLAQCVCVTLDNNTPKVVDRRELRLVGRDVPSSPYHHDTLGMDPREAEELVELVQRSVKEHTHAALRELRDALGRDVQLRAMAIRTPPLEKMPRTAAEAHASYFVQCRADGMLYHHALTTAAADLGMEVVTHSRGEEFANAAKALGNSEQAIKDLLAREGKRLGPPWTQEHQRAAAAALALLGGASK